MTAHELRYLRFLLSRIKELYVEKEAMSVVLDGRWEQSGTDHGVPWRKTVTTMQADPVYQSAVLANIAPYLQRVAQALQDESALERLQHADPSVGE